MGRTKPVPTNEPQHQSTQRNKSQQFVTWFIIFICGFIAGVAFTVYRGSSSGSASPATTAAQQQTDDFSQAILNLEAEATANPKNFQTWTRLGNLYFDTNQPEKAIGAYSKALELHGDDPNILTDMGVMYRRSGQPDKAIAAFDRAVSVAPNHQQALFNKGIVQYYDKHDHDGAIATWEQLLAINPEAKTGSGESIRDIVAAAKKDLATSQDSTQGNTTQQ